MLTWLGMTSVLAIVPAVIAKEKGKNFVGWWLYGFAFWIVATIHAVSLPALNTRETKKANMLKSSHLVSRVDVNSPVSIIKYDIYEEDGGSNYLYITFQNLDVGIVSAIKLSCVCRDSLGTVISVNGQSRYSVLVQDLCVDPQCIFADSSGIKLPDNSIRAVELTVLQVMFADGVIMDNDPQIIEVERVAIPDTEIDVAKSIYSMAKYYPEKHTGYWVCTCGQVNGMDVKTCRLCNGDKNYIFSAISVAEVFKVKEIKYKENIIEQKKEKQHQTKLNIAVATIFTIILVLCVAIPNLIVPELNYQKAIKLLSTGKENEAISAFTKLGEYRDSEQKIHESYYQRGVKLIANKQFYSAIESLEKCGGYSDAKKQIVLAYVEKANIETENRDYYAAYDTYLKLSKIIDCRENMRKVCYLQGDELLKQKEYYYAIGEYKLSDGYELATQKISECKEKLLEEALDLMEKENYYYAKKKLIQLEDEKYAHLIEKCNRKIALYH